jgi:hypothetical protein
MTNSTDAKKRIAKSKQEFDKKTYDNVGLRYKRGIKNILGYIAAESGYNLSDLFKISIGRYIEELTGKDVLTSIEPDIDMILKSVHKQTGSSKLYVYQDDFEKLLNLRQRAENNCNEQVISESDFLAQFKDNKGIIYTIAKRLAKSDDWYWTDSSIYDILYTLIYQANK